MNIDYRQLRQLRRAAGLTIQDVVRATGFKPSRIYNYENGVARPPANVLISLLELYGVTHRSLLTHGKNN